MQENQMVSLTKSIALISNLMSVFVWHPQIFCKMKLTLYQFFLIFNTFFYWFLCYITFPKWICMKFGKILVLNVLYQRSLTTSKCNTPVKICSRSTLQNIDIFDLDQELGIEWSHFDAAFFKWESSSSSLSMPNFMRIHIGHV